MCKCCEEIEFWKKEKKEELKRGIAESKLFYELQYILGEKENEK